jgi:hypothetical protein
MILVHCAARSGGDFVLSSGISPCGNRERLPHSDATRRCETPGLGTDPFAKIMSGMCTPSSGEVCTTDAGRSWTQISWEKPFPVAVQSLTFADARNGWLLFSGYDHLFRTMTGGTAWRQLP